MFPHWEAPKYTGAGDLHFISPKMAMHAEGRTGNIPHAISLMQPTTGGRKAVHAEIHPTTAKAKGISNGDKIRVKSDKGTIEATARITELVRPDVVMLPFEHGHWAQGRWAKTRGNQHVDTIITQQSDKISGMANYYTGLVSIERA
jgi:anaerobic selenocysteine-containing dehydrogenase